MPARERVTSLAEQEARAYRGQAPSGRAHASGPPAQLLWERFEHGPQSDLGVDLFSLDSLLRLDGVEADESSAAAGVVGALVEALGLDSAPGCGGAENAAAALGASGGEFTAVAAGGSPQHALLAVAVAGPRNLLLLRGSDGGAAANGGGPEEWALRVLPWLDGARAAVQHLAFAAPGGADRLLAATVAGGVYVLDAAAALQPEAPRSPGGAAPTPPVGTLASAGPPVAALAWWTRRQDGCDVALAATRAGDVRLWDGSSGTPLCAVAVPGRLRGMLLLPAPGAQSLLLWGDAGPASYGAAGGADPAPSAAWSLQLEREADGGGALPGAPPAVESLPDASGRPGFSPQPLAGRFGCATPGDDDDGDGDGDDGDGDDVALSLQPGAAAGGGPLVARFSRRSGLLRLYDPASPAPHPAAEHALPPGTVALRVTPRLVYCVHPAAAAGAPASENGWALSLIARHAAPRAFRGADAAQQLAPPLVLQRLRLAGDFSRGGGLLAPPGAMPAGPAARHHAPPVPGALLWSPAAVLRTSAIAPPEAHFCALLGAGRNLSAALGLPPPPPEADPYRDDDEYADEADAGVAEGDRRAALLGAALALDTAWLYKQAARECVRRGQLRRARRLFTLAGADPVDVVGTCLAEGRADEALAELAAMDAQAASRSIGLAATPGTDAMPRLRLACLAHLQLSAWAAAAAAAALQAAPPAAAAAAAEAAAAVEGTAHMMSSSAAAAAAAAVAEALQNESPDVSPDDAARVAAAAASACSAAAAAAAVATGLHDDVLRDGDDEEEGEGHASSHDAAAAAANAATSEAMLRLMLACGRVAEALCAQGVALAEGGGGPWLEEAQRDAVCAAAPRAEDAVAARRGSVHAAAAAAAAAPPGTPPPALALLDDEALLRLAAATAKGAAAPPRVAGRVAPGSAAATAAAAQAAADAEAHVSALFALAARSGGAASERDAPQQRRLEAAITAHWARLTPWRVAAAAEAWRNPAASGLIAQLRGDWAAAVRWRLAAMEARWRGRGAPAAAVVGRGGELAPADEADVEELAAMLSGPAANASSSASTSSAATSGDADRRAAAMAPAVIHWQRRGFPQPRLEAFLLARARASPAAAEAAVALLAAARAGALHLSGRFALRLAALRCADATSAHAAAHPLPPDALWRQVRGNLTRRMGTPTAIRFQWPPAEPPAAVQPPPPPPAIAAPPAGGEDGDIVMLEQVVPPAAPPAPPPPAAVAEPPEAEAEVVAFSCGHACGASRLATVLVPRLTQRLAQLRGGDGLRLSRALLAQEYDCGRVALACPACVAAAVAQQAAEPPQPPLVPALAAPDALAPLPSF